MEDRERIRQKKELIKEQIKKDNKEKYRQFLADQIDKKNIEKELLKGEEKEQAKIFGRIINKYNEDKENEFNNKIKRQNEYKKELKNQMAEKKIIETRKLENEKIVEDPNEVLAKIISNEKQIKMLQRGLLNN